MYKRQALNLADGPASLGFGVTPGKVLVDVLNHHQVFSPVNGSVELPVEPYSARVLLERDASEIDVYKRQPIGRKGGRRRCKL